MATQSLTHGMRTSRRIAQSYRKQGYRVVVPAEQETLPAFLRGCQPDLIAERDDDHVVVEIKQAGALKGANDLVELAERVAAEPGWRLELVTFKPRDPEGDIVSDPEWLTRRLSQPDLATDPSNASLRVIYLGQVLEFLLRGIAVRSHVRVRDKPARQIANELAFAGVMEEGILDRVKHALDYRDRLVHELDAPPAPNGQVIEMITLCRDIYRQCVIEIDSASSEA